MKELFGLRNRPDRFTQKSLAKSYSSGTVKPSRVVVVENNNDYGLQKGYYVTTPADAERVLRKTQGKITYKAPWEL